MLRTFSDIFGEKEALLLTGFVLLVGLGMWMFEIETPVSNWVAGESEPEEEMLTVLTEEPVSEEEEVGQVAGVSVTDEGLDEVEDDYAATQYEPVATPTPRASVAPTPRPAPSQAAIEACSASKLPVELFGGLACYQQSTLKRKVDGSKKTKQEAYLEVMTDAYAMKTRERLIRVCSTIGPGMYADCTESLLANASRFSNEIVARDRVAWEACRFDVPVGDEEEVALTRDVFVRARMDAAMEQLYLYCEQNNGDMSGFGFK